MSTKTALTILIIAAIIVIGFIVLRGPVEAPTVPVGEEPESAETPAPGEAGGQTEMTQENVVVYTDTGYVPGTLNIKAGETVTWRNQSSRDMWTASAIHPTHKVYPGSDIQLCGTAGALSIFDACQGIAAGGEWSFTFGERGTWRYHNHLQAPQTGTIVVDQ